MGYDAFDARSVKRRVLRFFIVGKNKHVITQYRRLIRKAGMRYTKERPDIVISLGGDGTLLYAERAYPGVPKLPIRNKSICNVCDWDSLGIILSGIRAGKYRIEKAMKLEAVVRNKGRLLRATCLNDVVIRNKQQTNCIRFEVAVNGRQVNGLLVGDGVTVSTPFGSGAYYYSITRKRFAKGIGVAFNNLTEPAKHLVLKENSVVTVTVVRNRALLSADNDPRMTGLRTGDRVKIRKSRKYAKIVKI
ncbi:MAG: NAD(+)/NADH kinase [Candidatus Aenigmarchaeota archaeon]|nr:NAD(+)/NADH kinase [Candidatus Aenigmarchaeota archaeon]